MQATLNRRQVREIDARAISEYGMSGLVLMENAGRGLADKLLQFGVAEPVVICCGKGNNGGDGFVMARHLDLRRVAVKVLVWGDPNALRGDAATNYRILARCPVPIEVFLRHDPGRLANCLDNAGWIVDALLGTGAEGPLREPFSAVIEQLNAHPAPKLAVDLPSGLDCDTGLAGPQTIRARHACTFVALKPGFLAPGAAAYVGEAHVLDIGAPRSLVESALREAQGVAAGAADPEPK